MDQVLQVGPVNIHPNDDFAVIMIPHGTDSAADIQHAVSEPQPLPECRYKAGFLGLFIHTLSPFDSVRHPKLESQSLSRRNRYEISKLLRITRTDNLYLPGNDCTMTKRAHTGVPAVRS
ncbi:hypothetical protein D3C81_1289050 [compost metagenome]